MIVSSDISPVLSGTRTGEVFVQCERCKQIKSIDIEGNYTLAKQNAGMIICRECQSFTYKRPWSEWNKIPLIEQKVLPYQTKDIREWDLEKLGGCGKFES